MPVWVKRNYKKPEKWEKIIDTAVRHIWKCHDKDCIDAHGQEHHAVAPNFYEQNGEPICSNCDEPLTYSHTEININR